MKIDQLWVRLVEGAFIFLSIKSQNIEFPILDFFDLYCRCAIQSGKYGCGLLILTGDTSLTGLEALWILKPRSAVRMSI